MGYDVAVFGELALPAGAAAKWKKLDATPSKRTDWPDGFATASAFRGTVAAACKLLATAPEGAWGWQLDVTAKRVAIRGVMADDCYLDCSRLIAQLWLRGGELGATGTLMFRGFETADTGWIVKPGKVKAMTKAEKQAADASPAMAALHDAAAAMVAELATANPFLQAAARGNAKRKIARGTELDAIIYNDSAKQRDRAAALAELVTLDPDAAEDALFNWLEHDDWWDDGKRQSLPAAAITAAAAIGNRACMDRVIEIYLANVNSRDWMLVAFAKAPGSATAAAIAEALTDAAIRAAVARASELLGVLATRGELGDRARIEAIDRDVVKIVGGCDLPDTSKVDWVRRIRAATAKLLA